MNTVVLMTTLFLAWRISKADFLRRDAGLRAMKL